MKRVWTYERLPGALCWLLRCREGDTVVLQYDVNEMTVIAEVLNDLEMRLAAAIAALDRCQDGHL